MTHYYTPVLQMSLRVVRYFCHLAHPYGKQTDTCRKTMPWSYVYTLNLIAQIALPIMHCYTGLLRWSVANHARVRLHSGLRPIVLVRIRARLHVQVHLNEPNQGRKRDWFWNKRSKGARCENALNVESVYLIKYQHWRSSRTEFVSMATVRPYSQCYIS